jgi:hypothetical protein
VAWQSWAEINPKVAERLGLEIGDLLKVESPSGSFQVPAYIHLAAPPDVVGIPFGQGHTFYTRYAEKRGVNVWDLVAPLADPDTGALAWAATRVRISKTGGHVDLPRFEGHVTPRQLPEAPVVPTVAWVQGVQPHGGVWGVPKEASILPLSSERD